MDLRATLVAIYGRLFAEYGPQHWWPGETQFEIMLGAILTQNTAWSNVELAITGLASAGLLEIAPLARADRGLVEACIRPSGYFRQKAGRIIGFAQYLLDRYDGDLARLFAQPLGPLREELLALNGIGPETADSMLLYAGSKPIFVVDAYTFRLFTRLGLFTPAKRDYHALQHLFMSVLDNDTAVFNEYHALVVAHGKYVCTSKPKCAACVLGSLCMANSDWRTASGEE